MGNRRTKREFSYTRPIILDGFQYPSADATISDENGNERRGLIFTDANGQYYTLDNNHNAVPTMPVENLDEVIITPNTSERQAYMRAAGYDVPNNGIWDSQQQSIWDSLTTRPKEYDTTLTGLAEGLWDKVTGNDTYKVDPTNPGSITAYNPDNIDWAKTRSSQNKAVKAISGTWGPILAASATPGLASMLYAAPIATGATLAGGYVGGKLADTVSEAYTGRDFGTNVAMSTPLTPGMGDFLNPGYAIGAGATPRLIASGDALITALTGESRNWLKPITREYIGKPYYDNIRPSGYGNNDEWAKDRNIQVFDMLKDFVKPRFLRNNVENPDYRPKWFVDKENPTEFEMFRNDAHRLSMNLDPHTELLPDGKLHTLYTKKPDGKYDVDWDYIRHIKQKYGKSPDSREEYMIDGFPMTVSYSGGNPSEGSVVANDFITLNGGFGNYTFDPDKVYLSGLTLDESIPPTYFSTGNVKFTDTWDVQPFKDARSARPTLTNFLTNVEDKNIPVISKGASNLKNVELVDAFGGMPFTQETMLPEQIIGWRFRDSKKPSSLAIKDANILK